MKRLLTPLLLGLVLVLTACGGSAAPAESAAPAVEAEVADVPPPVIATPGEAAAAMQDDMADAIGETLGETSPDMAGEMEETADMAGEEAMASEDASADSMAVAKAPWQTLPVTNSITGETFTLADFAGKTVYVEPMATWCTNCRQQLRTVQGAQPQLDSNNVEVVALSVETNIGSGDLANYAADMGFDFTFAVMTPELLEALVNEFGRTITNPPSTPHFVIQPDLSFGELHTGFSSADEVLALTGS